MKKFLIAASLFILSAASMAAPLTFDTAPVGYVPTATYAEGGYVFNLTLGQYGFQPHYGDGTGTPGTLNWHDGGDNGYGMLVTLSKSDNSLFDFTSFNLNAVDGLLTLTADTGAIAQFTTTGFKSLGFNGISSVSFLTSGYAVEIDNVNVADATRVPEPASLALLGLGFAGIAAARRRKQA